MEEKKEREYGGKKQHEYNGGRVTAKVGSIGKRQFLVG